ncbi:MAG: Lrp/AsnC family transcriptional regulator [Clostridia bacterium]|jgi:DNA-binding Lrp family transcriptional regulator|nr:Lrp/AsnC family transcriptional regulator [Clostridia bacterium]
MKYEVLKLLARNARYTHEEIAVMLDTTEENVTKIIAELEKDGLLKGYKAIVDWEKTEEAYVSAIIELNVVPKAGLGFEEVAEKIMKYPQVESVYLMSGVYDLNVVVKGKTLQDIAWFVARELSTIDSVTSTTTHFVMRRYKEMDVELVSDKDDDRGQLWV